MNILDEELLADLLMGWEESVEQGTELSPQELCCEFDHLENEVARRINALKELSWLDRSSSPPIDDAPGSDVPRASADRYRLIAPSGEGLHATEWKGFGERLLMDFAVKSPNPAHRGMEHPMYRWILALFLAVCFAAMPSLAFAEEAEEKQLFAKPKRDWEWDEDKRFDFLVERLASLEASLEAVERAIAKASGTRGAQRGTARRADANNSMMDRKGGGPMKWNEFYGTNAEKFFYHPVDPNTTYHTNTALKQMGNYQDDKGGNGVPATQSLPVHQRPPQWDYIYRANRDAAERAEQEANKLQGKIEDLNARRFQLEQEQVDLWAKLAFRVIQRLNIPRKPVLRFSLKAKSSNTEDAEKARALQAAARFLSAPLLVIDKADKEQATALTSVKHIVSDAREALDDELIQAHSLAEDAANKETLLGKYVALVQLLDDTAKNLGESYEVAMEGDKANDAVRKERFRGLLQRSLVEYSQILLGLDELVSAMKVEWGVGIDSKNKLPVINVAWIGGSPPSTGSQKMLKVAPTSSATPPKTKKKPSVFKFRTEEEIEESWAFGNDEWRLENGGIRFTGSGAVVSRQEYVGDFVLEIEYKGFLSVSACGSSFEGRELELSTAATLERRGNVLTFRTAATTPVIVTLKKSERENATKIQVGNYRGVLGDVAIVSVKMLGQNDDAD